MTDQEINEAVAVKLGWTLCKERPTEGARGKYKTLAGIALEQVPDYCASIAAAWEVVEYLVKQGHAYKIEQDFGMDDFVRVVICPISKAGEACCDFTDADTAPMAICLAFLKLGDNV